jgi:hypothetical protein
MRLSFDYLQKRVETLRAPHAAPRKRVPTASERSGVFIWSIIVPTDGTNAARVANENFGTFSFYGSSRVNYGIPALVYLWCCDLKHNSKWGISGN